MQKNKITMERRFYRKFYAADFYRTKVKDYILEFISQERKQWEDEMREMIEDRLDQAIYDNMKVSDIRESILSLLESKEEKSE